MLPAFLSLVCESLRLNSPNVGYLDAQHVRLSIHDAELVRVAHHVLRRRRRVAVCGQGRVSLVCAHGC